MSLNKVQIIGKLGRDPIVKSFQNGGKVCNLSVATSEAWTDKSSGERKEQTEWHRVAIFNPHLVDVAEKYLTKGSEVYLEGKLQTRKYTDKDGAEKYTTEIILSQYKGELQLIGRAKQADESEPAQPAAAPAKSALNDFDDFVPF